VISAYFLENNLWICIIVNIYDGKRNEEHHLWQYIRK
jgi:hypothetical protein